MMDSEQMLALLQQALDDKKAQAIEVIDLRGRSPIADFFLVATGTSTTHVSALAEEVDRVAHQNKIPVLGIEGAQVADWILIDLEDVIVHVFREAVREFYNLEKLWSPTAALASRATPRLAVEGQAEPVVPPAL
jgi:ribosome-associated protein